MATLKQNAKAVLKVLRLYDKPIRVPTMCWLGSDLLGLLDSEVRYALEHLKETGWIRVDNGGWIRSKM